MASNPKLLQYIEDKIKALIEVRMGNVKEIVVDDALSDTSTNPVQNAVIKYALDNKVNAMAGMGLSEENFTTELKTKLEGLDPGGGGGGSVTVDDAMSDSSTNPVQNKVIKSYVDGKAVTVDSALDSTSENPVQNKVIKQELSNKKDINSPVVTTTGNIANLLNFIRGLTASGIYAVPSQNAADAPRTGVVSFTIIHYRSQSFVYLYNFVVNEIYYARVSSASQSTLEWSKIV